MAAEQPQLPARWQLPAGYQHELEPPGWLMALNSLYNFVLNDL
jgi:hypothetical protein